MAAGRKFDVVLPEVLWSALERERARLEAERPGERVTISDAARSCLARVLLSGGQVAQSSPPAPPLTAPVESSAHARSTTPAPAPRRARGGDSSEVAPPLVCSAEEAPAGGEARACEFCGKSFTPPAKGAARARFCSDAHRFAAAKARKRQGAPESSAAAG